MQCKGCKKDCLESELINSLCAECRNKNIKITNSVSNKITYIIYILHLVGYAFSIIAGIVFIANEQVLFGIVVVICGIVFTWLGTLFLEALAEIIQLLEDIKNK